MPVFAILNASPENVIFEVWCMLNLANFKLIVDRLDALLLMWQFSPKSISARPPPLYHR